MSVDIFDDVPEGPSEDGLTRLSRMFAQRSELDQQREALEAQLKVINEDLRRLDEVDFPELFDEVGVTSFTVGNRKVSVKEKLYGGLPKDAVERKQAFDIIKSLGGDSLIKAEVSVTLDKGEYERAKEIADGIAARGFNPVVAENIHSSTLHKWVREQLEAGSVLDIKALGLYHRRFVEVK